MKTKSYETLRDLGAVSRKTRALTNQPVFDGGNIVPFVTQPRPNDPC